MQAAAIREPVELPFLRWLLDAPPSDQNPPPAPPSPAGRALLARVDAVIASDTQRADLLPRAPQVVPQLMKALRDESYSSAEVAARMSKDAVLASEVVRLANVARRAGQEPVADLAHAVTAVGVAGLRRAIARTVLRPMFDARGDSLSARASRQIWENGDHKSRLCAALAANDLLDPLDGYLAGLLHGIGWTALFRALDGTDPAALLEPALAPELARRRDTLFGKLVAPWGLSDALGQLAAEVAAVGLPAARSPLARALRTADHLAALHALNAAGRLPEGLAPWFEGLPEIQRDCYFTTLVI